MRQVFVVTDGSYEDYHIVGVFSTERLARDECLRLTKLDDAGYAEAERLYCHTPSDVARRKAESLHWRVREAFLNGPPCIEVYDLDVRGCLAG